MVTVVAGPPGAGKSTHVRERARWGDLIVDTDLLFGALSLLPEYEKPDALLPFVLTARDAVVAQLTRPGNVVRAWLIVTMPRARDRLELCRRLGARSIVLEIGTEECMKRIQNDERRSDKASLWRTHVEKWWSEYQRDPSDTIVTDDGSTRRSMRRAGGGLESL